MWNPWRGCHKYSEGCKFVIFTREIVNVTWIQTELFVALMVLMYLWRETSMGHTR